MYYRKYTRLSISIIVLFFSQISKGQINHDKQWILTNFIHFVFNQNDTYTDIIEHPLGRTTSPFNTAMSSEEGDLLFHTSGCFIMDNESNIMENGDSLNPGVLELGYCKFGDAIWYQDVIILPFPGSKEQYILFTFDIGTPFIGDTLHYPLAPLHVYYHLIDMHFNNGKGKVIEKNTVIISDTLAHGYIQACKHANGRDWWVIVPEWNSNCYYSICVSPNSVSQPQKFCLGERFGDIDFGTSVGFSPDGRWYARNQRSEDTLGHLNLYSFDRCLGQLTEVINLQYPIDTPYYSGLSFSPGSQFLYISSYKSLWQFDLLQNDIQNSLVLSGQIQNNFTSEKGSLYFQQLAPNRRIYIASPFGHKYLSTIHYPDRKGLECGFKAHDFQMPLLRQNYGGLSNYPNYRLGPIDGSNCDTLEIDNIPVSNFRYEINTLDSLTVEFINLSYFEPDSFKWYFGDGQESVLSDPVQTYLESGIYNVCLIAKNEFASDTFCQELVLQSTLTIKINPERTISFYPNPVYDELIVETDSEIPLLFKLFDILGREVFRTKLMSKISTIDINQIPSGLYFINIQGEQQEALLNSPIIIQSSH